MDLATGAMAKRVASPLTLAALHECHCDRQGRFWVGSIDHRIGKPDMLPGGGSLFRLDGSKLTEILKGISCSNGLAFGPDGKSMYHTDSPTGIINAWDLDPSTGQISRERELFRLKGERGFCDGATVDTEGGYWATIVFGSKLRRYLPDGTLDLEVELPFDAPTKLAFGGPDLDTLYITTTRLTLPESLTKAMPRGPGLELLGGVFSFKPGVKGVAESVLPE
jgi:sugar lactone lactonase YvrE